MDYGDIYLYVRTALSSSRCLSLPECTWCERDWVFSRQHYTMPKKLSIFSAWMNRWWGLTKASTWDRVAAKSQSDW